MPIKEFHLDKILENMGYSIDEVRKKLHMLKFLFYFQQIFPKIVHRSLYFTRMRLL